tara:strand:- start:199 stop:810 length:612 start_codon:yes stop_codon:yes gene_type:complete
MSHVEISMDVKKPIVYKLVFMGDSGVGKTAIATRIACNIFTPCSEATIGASYFSKVIYKNNKRYNLNIWDTAGQEKYRCLVPLYYNNADAAIIVYDVTNKKSYESAKENVQELREKTKVAVILFIGNKSDLLDDRRVKYREVKEYADEENLIFYETSAKLGLNITEMLHEMIDKLPEPQPTNGITLPNVPTEQSDWRSCCNIN